MSFINSFFLLLLFVDLFNGIQFPLNSLDNGLVAYYPLNDNANDASGNNNHGVTRSLTPDGDRLGRAKSCYWFSGFGSYIEVAKGNAFNFANDMSMTMWIKAWDKSRNYLVSKSDFSSSTNKHTGGFSVRSVTAGNFRLTLTHGLNVSMDSQSFILPIKQWFHLAIVKNDNTSVVYVNGVEVSRTVFPFQSIFPNGNLPLIIGSTNRGQTNPATNLDLYFRGYLDEIYFYNRSLTMLEVLYLSQNQTTMFPSLQPSREPTVRPTLSPTLTPTASPTVTSSAIPTSEHSREPTRSPSTSRPSFAPTRSPTVAPTALPTLSPSAAPSFVLTGAPSFSPSTASPSTIRIRTMGDDINSLKQMYRLLNGQYWSFPVGKQWNLSSDPCVDKWYGLDCQLTANNKYFVSSIQLNSMNLRGSITSDMLSFYSLDLLSLANNQLGGSLPDLRTFPDLGFMNLSNNEFTDAIPLLPSLNTLDVSNNFFNLVGYPIDTNGRNPIFRIQYLYLNNNLLAKIPVFQNSNFPNISVIDLSYNKLGDRSEEIMIPSEGVNGRVSSLSSLFLQGNNFKQFPTFLNYYPTITILDISTNELKNCSNFARITIFVSLQELYLRRNQIRECDFATESVPSLTILDLSDNFLFRFPVFTSPTQLKQLILSNNRIRSSASTFTSSRRSIALSDSQLTNFPGLSVLSLANNLLTKFPPLSIDGGFTLLLPTLQALDLSKNSIQETIPSILGNISSLEILNLHENQLIGNIPNFLSCFQLKVLDVTMNSLSGSIPNFASNIQLQSLLLSHNEFTGTIPTFGKLSNLTTLSVSHNSLVGLQSHSFSNLKNLSSLDISYNPFRSFPAYLVIPKKSSNIPGSAGSSVSLSLNLAGSGLNEIPGFIFNSSLLITSLDLSDNRFQNCSNLFNQSATLQHLLSLNLRKNSFQECYFDGNSFPSITSLDMSENGLIDFPFLEDQGDVLKHLVTFNCANNKITELPGFLSSLMPNVAFLDMSHNDLQGNIPAGLSDLTNLTFIDLSVNKLTGTIPSFQNQRQLTHFYIADNQLTGPFPTLPVDKLQIIHLQNNRFNTTIPLNAISKMTSLRQFSIQNNHFYNDALDRSSLLETLSHLPQLQFVNVSFNEFHEMIPATFFQGTPFQYLDLRNNFFYGSLPKIVSSKLLYLNLENNMLSGILSEESVPRRLTGFYINDNYFSGQLPSNFLTNFGLLSSFQLSNNHFSGNLVDIFLPQSQGAAAVSVATAPHASQAPVKTYPNVIYFSVKGNSFEGNLETLLSLFPNLRVLEVSANGFTGELKDSVKVMKSLMYVDVSGNDLSGDIGTLFDPLQQSSLTFIDLSDNRFSGHLSEEFFLGVSKSLQLFSATKNCIGGSIPEEICEAKHLKSLRLDGLGSASTCRVNLLPTDIGKSESSSNKESYRLKHPVEGSLPICLLENLPELQSLYISGNGLSGSFPHNISLSSSSSRLREFVFSYNRLTGSIPSALQSYRHWKIFDGSFNKLNGVLDGSNGFCRVKDVLQLNGNRLSGDIPSCLLGDITPSKDNEFLHSQNETSFLSPSSSSSSLQVTILEGNLFNCQLSPGTTIGSGSGHEKSQLPLTDPYYDRYLCASQVVDDAIITWTTLLGFLLLILLIDYVWYCYLRPYLCSSSSLNTAKGSQKTLISPTSEQGNGEDNHFNHHKKEKEKEKHKKTRHERMKEFYQLCSIWLEEGNPFALKIQEKNQQFFQRFLFPSTPSRMKTSPSSNSIPELLKTLYYLRWFSIGILTFILIVLLPIYGGFYPFRTHSFAYIWSISIGYLSGIIPSLFLLGIFAFFYFILVNYFKEIVHSLELLTNRNEAGQFINSLSSESHFFDNISKQKPTNPANSSEKESTTSTTSGNSSSISSWIIQTCCSCGCSCKISFSSMKLFCSKIPWLTLFAYFSVFVINLLVMFGASIGYVKLLNSNISAGERIGLQIAMAILKLLWSFFFIKRIFLACLKNFEFYLEEQAEKQQHSQDSNNTGVTSIGIEPSASLSSNSQDEILNQQNKLRKQIRSAMSSKKLIFLSFLVIINFVIAPIFAVAIFDANCFKYVFFPSPTISSHQEVTIENLFCSKVIVSYNFMGFTQINENTFCNSETITNEIDFNPPYLYSYQCTSTLLSEFVAIYVYQYCFSLCLLLISIGLLLLLEKYHIYSEILTTIFLPKPLYFSILVYRREKLLYNPIQKIELFLKHYLPKYFFIDWDDMGHNDHLRLNEHDETKKNNSKNNNNQNDNTNNEVLTIYSSLHYHHYHNKCFDGDVVVIGFMGDLILLLTFGMAFPLLAILCTMAIILKTKYQQLIIGRLIYELKATILKEDFKESDEVILEEMMRRVADLLRFNPTLTNKHHNHQEDFMMIQEPHSYDEEDALDPFLIPLPLIPMDSYSHLEQAEGTNISHFQENPLKIRTIAGYRQEDRWLDPEEYLKTFCYESHFFLHYFISMGKYLLNFSAIFFSFFLFDMLGDVLGINRSIWIIPICSILPLLAWLFYSWKVTFFKAFKGMTLRVIPGLTYSSHGTNEVEEEKVSSSSSPSKIKNHQGKYEIISSENDEELIEKQRQQQLEQSDQMEEGNINPSAIESKIDKSSDSQEEQLKTRETELLLLSSKEKEQQYQHQHQHQYSLFSQADSPRNNNNNHPHHHSVASTLDHGESIYLHTNQHEDQHHNHNPTNSLSPRSVHAHNNTPKKTVHFEF